MKAQIILNPAAGQRDLRADLNRAVAYLESQGWAISLAETRARGDATALARMAAEAGYDAVFVVGGDGTLNEAANGLAGTDVALGVLPAGTGNVWAAEIGLLPIPTPLHRPNLLAAAQALSAGTTRWIDLGRAGERYFLLWAGIGFDAELVKLIETEARPMKARLGPLAYGITGVVAALRFQGRRVLLEIDDRRVRARVILVVVSNAQLYAGAVRVAPGARLDDGRLDVCIFRGYGLLYTLRHLIGIATGRHLHDPEVTCCQAERLSLRTRKPLQVHVDGDPIGTTPMEFQVIPRALRVMLPAHIPEHLFSTSPSTTLKPVTEESPA